MTDPGHLGLLLNELGNDDDLASGCSCSVLYSVFESQGTQAMLLEGTICGEMELLGNMYTVSDCVSFLQEA